MIKTPPTLVSPIFPKAGNPIASSAVCAGPEWDDLCAVTRVAATGNQCPVLASYGRLLLRAGVRLSCLG